VLQGFTVGITSDRLREEQAAYLRGYGASVVHAPCLTTLASRTPEELRHATLGLIKSPPDAFVANTATGMAHWLAAAERWGLADDLKQALASMRVSIWSSPRPGGG
jgi:uroporphyrinogen-III synthase